jgi:hypothetical protein
MANKATTTTPDPELSTPLGKEADPAPPLAGENARKEVAGCPTGLGAAEQAQQSQRQGGGGAPGTGEADLAEEDGKLEVELLEGRQEAARED